MAPEADLLAVQMHHWCHAAALPLMQHGCVALLRPVVSVSATCSLKAAVWLVTLNSCSSAMGHMHTNISHDS
eukprot:360851-Chlamydomonas_euryale.AAC.7